MLTATVWVQLRLVVLLKSNLTASTRGYSVLPWVVGLILCQTTSQFSRKVTASAGVFPISDCLVAHTQKILVSLESLLSALSDKLSFEFVASIFHHSHNSHCHHVSVLMFWLCYFICVDLCLFN